jgi:hypothetical protein
MVNTAVITVITATGAMVTGAMVITVLMITSIIMLAMMIRQCRELIINKLAPIALIVICLSVFAWALLRANAAWHFIAAQAIAEPLFATGAGSAAAFEASEARINTALRRFPGNPDYLDFAGRLLTLEASQPGVMGTEQHVLLESAATNFRQALTVRPLWPYTWVNLLSTKDQLGQVDLEFNMALNRSAELGPWEPRVQMQVVESGLRNWSKLGSAERAVVQQKVLDALRRQPRQVFTVVKNYGRPDLICDVEGTQVQIRKWCAQVSAQG